MASFPYKNVADQQKYSIEQCAVTGALNSGTTLNGLISLTLVQKGNIVYISYPAFSTAAGGANVVAITLAPYFILLGGTTGGGFNTTVPTNTAGTAGQASIVTAGGPPPVTTLTFSAIGGTAFGATTIIPAGMITCMLAQANLS